MIDELEKIVGRQNVSENDISRLVYSQDASQLEGNTKVVVWPQSAKQVSSLMKFAKDSKIDVVPRGGGTSLVGGVIPDDSIVLDMSRMNRIIEVNEGKKYAVVEPGVILEELNLKLKDKKLSFPVIPASWRVCTLGGMISTNAVGERALKYGRTGGWILSLEIVDGMGEIHELDVNDAQDIVGTEGCVGIITQAKLKLADAIGERSISLLEFDTIGALAEGAKNYREQDDVLAIEYVDKTASEITEVAGNYTLTVEFQSGKGEIKDEREIERIWDGREGVGAILSSKGYSIKEDPKIPLDKIPEFLEWLEKNQIPSFGHISVGIIHPRFKAGQEGLIRQMFELVEGLDGTVSGEHGIGLTKKEYVPKELVDKIRKLKADYDPQGILNRGKICQT